MTSKQDIELLTEFQRYAAYGSPEHDAMTRAITRLARTQEAAATLELCAAWLAGFDRGHNSGSHAPNGHGIEERVGGWAAYKAELAKAQP